ncbi:hypothetical protein [Xenorhabdus anantnagensis]|uniref:Uncharacterized protein n=1 Tax=Xenorhabdus anantnagensis TaxID=3025875 RepID=A0ABT5LRL3_9GAMM|nr:hypothetical protein [Xenorhabdus anantnagensis]MDC9596950.1 hypothetical protein [Xenorhabdus anantnagensis]
MMKKLFVVILTIFCVAFGSLSHAASSADHYKKSCKHNVVNELKKFKSKTFQFGNNTFKLEKSGMKHILERHHPYYWDGSTKPKQSYFTCDMTVINIADAIYSIMKQNRDTLVKKGHVRRLQIIGTYKGKIYTVGFKRGRVGQFYPEKKE